MILILILANFCTRHLPSLHFNRSPVIPSFVPHQDACYQLPAEYRNKKPIFDINENVNERTKISKQSSYHIYASEHQFEQVLESDDFLLHTSPVSKGVDHASLRPATTSLPSGHTSSPSKSTQRSESPNEFLLN